MKLFCKLLEPKNLIEDEYELTIIKNKKNIEIRLDVEDIKLFYYPVLTDNGVKLDKIIFPVKGKIKKNKYYFYFNYNFKNVDIIKNIDLFPNYFLSEIYLNLINTNYEIEDVKYYEQDLIEDLKYFYDIEFKLDDLLLKLFQLPLKLKMLVLLKYNNAKNLDHLFTLENEIMFNGQYFDNLKCLLNLEPNNRELKYYNNIKSLNGNKYFCSGNKDIKKILNSFLLNYDFTDLIGKYLDNNLKERFNNFINIYKNFHNHELSEFQIILLIISNNYKFCGENNYYKNLLNQCKEILNTTNFIDIKQVNLNDITNLKLFIEKYNKFKIYFFESLKNIKFPLNFKKKNLDSNIIKLIYLFKNDFEKNKNLLDYLDKNIKSQMETIFLNKFNLSNEKIYRDYTLRLYQKMFLSEDENFLNDFNKYNFFRNYFLNIKWNDLINNYELINMIYNNSHILLYNGNPNNIIFNNINYKDITKLIKNKFVVLNFLENYVKILDFIKFNYNDLGLILENFQSLSKHQLKDLAKIIYLSKFITNYNSECYNDFIKICSKCNFILTNNNFNLKIKSYLNNYSINYGKIVRDIKSKNFNKNQKSPYEENIILKKKYLKYRKKYSKYKSKYFLEKEKNTIGYIKNKIK